MLLLDLSTYAQEWIAQYGYWGPFVVLILCGFGLPLPEEVSLIGAGLLIYEGHDYWTMLAICIAGVLVGDSVPYTVGRVFGEDALRLRRVRRMLHPRRFRRLERRFQEHRNWAIFSCRFFPGIRWPSYFLAGSMRMSVGRWLTLDLAGALIQVPLALYLGLVFGANIERLRSELESFQLIAAAAAGLVVVGFLTWRWLRRRERLRTTAPAGPIGLAGTLRDGPPAAPGPESADSGRPGPGAEDSVPPASSDPQAGPRDPEREADATLLRRVAAGGPTDRGAAAADADSGREA